MNNLTSVCLLVVCTLVVSGCASTGGSKAEHADAGDAAVDLYDGEPRVVFATEFPVASADDAIARADHALRKGDTDLALYMYVRAYDLEKDNVYVLARIGEIHMKRGNDRLAIAALTSALHYEPTNAMALQSLGLVYLQAKRHDEAQALLEQAIAQDATLWRAQNAVGVIYDMQGEHKRAIGAYDAALEVNPGDASLLNNRGYSLYLDGQYDAAIRDFIAAASHGADRAWLNLGLVKARQRQYQEAVQMMARKVSSEVAYNDVGYIAMRQGDLTIAELYFRKAIDLAPRHFEAAQRNMTELKERVVSETEPAFAAGDTG